MLNELLPGLRPTSLLQLHSSSSSRAAGEWKFSFCWGAYRASAWSPVHCFLFFSAPSINQFINESIAGLPLKKEEKQFTLFLSFCLIGIGLFVCVCLLFFAEHWRCSAHNPQKKRKHQTTLHPSNSGCLHQKFTSFTFALRLVWSFAASSSTLSSFQSTFPFGRESWRKEESWMLCGRP